MRTIWKYAWELSLLTDVLTFRMPVGAEVLSVGNQYENLTLWVMADPRVDHEQRWFRVVGTGLPVDEHTLGRFLGAVQFAGGRLVYHLFELVTP